MKIKLIALFTALLLVMGLGLSSCGFTNSDVTDPSVTSLRYDGGHTSGRKFKECVPAGTKLATDDTLYPYPNTQRQDVWSDSIQGADHNSLAITDNSGVGLNTAINVQFFLNTSCTPVTVDGHKYPGGTLQAFHELVGKTRHAYFNNDGTYGKGWLQAMDYYISAPVEQYLNTATKGYTAQQLWLNQPVDDGSGNMVPVQTVIADGLTKALPGLVNDGMETDLQFYQKFKVSVISMTPGADYLDLFKQRQQAQVEAQTAQDNATAQVAQAEAQEKVEAAKAKTLQATIAGYGGIQAYLEHEAIDKGINPFQPGGVLTTNN